MTLDELYGPGAEQGLIAALDRALGNPQFRYDVTGADGTIYASIRWGSGQNSQLLGMAFMPTRVHFTKLQARGAGLYPSLCGQLPAYMKSLGVLTFTANALSQAQADQLIAGSQGYIGTGFVQVPGTGRLVWTL